MNKLYHREWLAIISLSVICQLSTFGQTCPNVPTTYYYTQSDRVISSPHQAYYSDGTLPPQSGDGNGNLIVTWPHPGQGYVYYYTYNGEIYWAVNAPVTIGSVPSFVSAPSVLCNSQTSTFTISDVCGTSFTWVAPTGWSINGGGNSLTTSLQSVNITAPSTGYGSGTINVTSNYNSAISTYVWFGAPTISAPNTTGSCRNPVYIYTASPIGAYSYSWSINNSSLSLTSSARSQCQVVLMGTQTGLYTFNLSLTITSGSCALVTTANEYYYSSDQSPCNVEDQRQAANNQNDNQADSEANVALNTPYPQPANNQFSVALLTRIKPFYTFRYYRKSIQTIFWRWSSQYRYT